MDMSLVSDRLLLRPYRQSDIDAMATMFDDPEVTRHTLLGRRNREQTMAILAEYMEYIDRNGYGMLAITDRETGAYLGECGLFDVPDTNAVIALRYALNRDAWGKGCAQEASRLVIADYFERLPFDELFAGITPTNHASLNVIRKLGFAHRGMRNVHGVDYELYGMTRADWLSQR